jgi:hypothetical protein
VKIGDTTILALHVNSWWFERISYAPPPERTLKT